MAEEEGDAYIITSSLATLGARKAKLNVYQNKFGKEKEGNLADSSDGSQCEKPVSTTKKPTTKLKRKEPKKSEPNRKKSGPKLYCVCRRPYDPDDERIMIKCDFCPEWFHLDCIGLTEREANMLSKYKCDGCEDREAREREMQRLEEEKRLKKLMKGKKSKETCMTRGCKSKARLNSKYCSDECAGLKAREWLRVKRMEVKASEEKRRRVLCLQLLKEWKKISKQNVGETTQKFLDDDRYEKLNIGDFIQYLDFPIELPLPPIPSLAPERLNRAEFDKPFTLLSTIQFQISNKMKQLQDTERDAEIVEELIEKSLVVVASSLDSSLHSPDSPNSQPGSPTRTEGHLQHPEKLKDLKEKETIDCVCCGHPIVSRIFQKHAENCYIKKEQRAGGIMNAVGLDLNASAAFDSSVHSQLEQWRCGAYDAKKLLLCNKLAASCSVHVEDVKGKQAEMKCGCPIKCRGWMGFDLCSEDGPEARESFVGLSNVEVCNLSRQECEKHIGWEKLYRSLSLQRVIRAETELRQLEHNAFLLRGRILKLLQDISLRKNEIDKVVVEVV